MRSTRLLPGLSALAVLAAGLVACSSSGGHPDPGPLGYPGNPGNQSVLCQPDLRPHQAETVGIDDFANNGQDTVVIDRLALASARHLRLVGGYIVPGRWAVGQWATFPPPARQLPREVQWTRRHVPAGARVLPGHWINVVVGLEPTGATGSTAGVQILYHVGSTPYLRQSSVKTIIKVPPAKCT